MKKPLPTAKQIPTILKAGLAFVSTSPAAEWLALALAVLDAILVTEDDIWKRERREGRV
jgi:hypothetical protein